MRIALWIANLRGWYYQPALLVLIGAGVIVGLFASREFEQGDWTQGDYLLFGSLAVLVAGVAGLQALRDAGQRRIARDLDDAIIDARAKMRTDFGDALDTAIEELGAMIGAAAPKRRELYGGVIQLLLSAACQLTGPGDGRIRASFFEYRPASAGNLEGLYHYASAGRQRASTFDFIAGEDIGDRALEMVKSRGWDIETDVAGNPPKQWTKGTPAAYEAFLSVSCGIKNEPAGMLNVDSTQADDIDEDDVAMLTLIGRMISVACRLRG